MAERRIATLADNVATGGSVIATAFGIAGGGIGALEQTVTAPSSLLPHVVQITEYTPNAQGGLEVAGHLVQQIPGITPEHAIAGIALVLGIGGISALSVSLRRRYRLNQLTHSKS